MPTRDLGGAAAARRTQKGDPHGKIGPPPPGHRADAEESPRRPPAKPGAPAPIGKGAGRLVAWLAKLQQQALDVFIPEENPPPLASILLAPET